MDQLESSTPGLVAQSKGQSTNKRFTCATVVIDHFSRLSYVHMQETNGAVETLAAKHAFERYALSHNVTIKRYHGDNGRFSDNLFRKDCQQQGQQLTFLWRQRSFSKWHSRKTHSRLTRSRKDHDRSCQTQMAKRHHVQLVAIRHSTCK
jgi:hypothetical protein